MKFSRLKYLLNESLDWVLPFAGVLVTVLLLYSVCLMMVELARQVF